MDGEPQLGKVRDITDTYDRDDIIEAITAEFEGGPVEDTSHQITLGENQEDIGDYITEDDLQVINTELATLLDDVFGTEEYFTFLNGLLEGLVDKNAEAEYEGQEYGH